jgi:ribosome-associated protein
LKEIKVLGDHINLGQLLKLIGEASSGGDARSYLVERKVLVNNERETRRGRKLRAGDVVQTGSGEEVSLV